MYVEVPFFSMVLQVCSDYLLSTAHSFNKVLCSMRPQEVA
jgi:hypothetical protein